MRKPEHYREDCDRIASVYDPFVRFISSFFGGERNLRMAVIDKMDLKPDQRVLDVCCGTGTLCAMVSDVTGDKGEVVGIDLSENMLKRAEKKKKGNMRFHLSNAEEIPFGNGYFDHACITFGLHEMPHPVRMNVLREMRRVLKPDGRITVLEYSYPPNMLVRFLLNIWMLVEGETARDLVNRDLSSMLRDTGFNVIGRSIRWLGIIQIVRGENADR